MVVIGQDVITDIVTIRETTVIEENEIDMNVMEDDMNETTDGNDDGKENENEDGKKKTRRSSSTLTDCKARIGLKGIVGTNAFRLEFGEYMFIHRASLSNIGPQKAHRLRVALLGGFDKVRGMPIDWNNFKRGMNKFIGERDAQMLVDKMVKRQLHVPEFSFYHHTIKNKLVRMFWADETMKCNYAAFGDIVSFDATYDTNKCWGDVDRGASVWFDEDDVMIGKFKRILPGLFSSWKLVGTFCFVLNNYGETEYTHILYLGMFNQKYARVYMYVRKLVIVLLETLKECYYKTPKVDKRKDYSFEEQGGWTLGMDTIPENYISRRWRKNPLPDHLRDKRHRYGPCIEESESLASDIYSRVEDCINLIRNFPDYSSRRKKMTGSEINETKTNEEDVEVDDVDEDDGTDEHDEDEDVD
ncbi:FAR1-related sequence 5-like protein [Tanacetum coccineum]|uniref:FAR1-related sequence 5-like protein n=1 Tax=Tanacetum coccineum TaxID=301880 RepID=A0ABQ5ISV1_9ASTR